MAGQIIQAMQYDDQDDDDDDTTLLIRATPAKGVYLVQLRQHGRVVCSAKGTKEQLGMFGYYLGGATMFGSVLDDANGPYIEMDDGTIL